ncbi:Cytochrome c biogenesis protein CcmG [Cedecea neteri]|uniref:Cytochrome c biogenesis protein CcmG n=1 Tax=Cedecea neteri TaxID=158822 RepID=A0A2X3IHP8_9ENTR|nr:Cytochrome c biogenesis protein CcmG [Cedecea neteri]
MGPRSTGGRQTAAAERLGGPGAQPAAPRHKFLNGLAAQGVRVVGMNYKDDRHKAINWLRDLGNPYMLKPF